MKDLAFSFIIKGTKGGVDMSNLINSESIFLLYGDIPIERMFTLDGVIQIKDDEEKLKKDLRSRFYSKSKCGTDSFTVGSISESMVSDDIYFFGYSDKECDEFSKAFVELRCFLNNARFIGRKFVPKKANVYESFQGRAISPLEVEMVENDDISYDLVCVLGNVAMIKEPAILFSGYKLVSILQTPLVGNKYEFVPGEENKYDVEDIVKGINSDLNGDILPSINSLLDVDDSVSISLGF